MRKILYSLWKSTFLNKKEEIILTGEFKVNGKFGEQFHVESWKRPIPETEVQLVSFFSSSLFKGIGKKMAVKIVKKIGNNAINRIVKEGIKCLEKVEGLHKEMAQTIVDTVQRNFVINDLIEQYHFYKIPSDIIIKAYAILGLNVVDLSDNPYLLAELNLITFDRADDIAGEMAISPYNNKRLETAIKLSIKEQITNQGHCYLEETAFINLCLKLLNSRKINVQDLVYEGLLIQTMEQSKACYLMNEKVYPTSIFYAERNVARSIHELTSSNNLIEERKIRCAIKKFELNSGFNLADMQKEAIHLLFNENVLILTGGPGTGKTFTINAILEVYKQLIPNPEISLSAPTGRAAKKLGEVTGMGSHAQTIHRLLGIGYLGHDKPLFDDTITLPFNLLVVDEFSMIDIHLASHLFKAIKQGTRVLLVGDQDQLPSVGSGNVLKDLLDAGIPHVRLNQIFRQSEQSTIVKNSHKINRGEMIDLENKHDHFFIESNHPNRTSELIVQSVVRFLDKGYDINDILVLSPMKKGTLGIENLNEMIRNKINPITSEKEKNSTSPFRKGDKVMYLRNNRDADLYNGDIGIVKSVNQSHVTVDFNNHTVQLDKEEWKHLVLANALSIHKSQGGQAPIVLTVLSDEHSLMLMRNLFYTAITRTEKIFVLFGTKAAIEQSINTNQVRERKTSLAEQLKDYRKYIPFKKNIG
jgi:exodeoxyribonuclease V alpha subunit